MFLHVRQDEINCSREEQLFIRNRVKTYKENTPTFVTTIMLSWLYPCFHTYTYTFTPGTPLLRLYPYPNLDLLFCARNRSYASVFAPGTTLLRLYLLFCTRDYTFAPVSTPGPVSTLLHPHPQPQLCSFFCARDYTFVPIYTPVPIHTHPCPLKNEWALF